MSSAPEASILVVDDEEEIRVLLYTLLQDAGFEVRVAESAEVALSAMKERPADLIIADYLMPDMNGLELLEATWAFTPRPKTIMLTGYATVDMALEAARLGIVQVITKPFIANELIALIQRTLADKSEGIASFEVPDLWAESEKVLTDARRILSSLKKRLKAPQEMAPVETPLKDEATIAFGPAGTVRLPRAVVIVDVIKLDDKRAAVGVFVDDGGRASTITVTSPFCSDGKELSLKKIRDGISYSKVHPLSLHYGNFFHFKDDNGDILNDLSCLLDLTKRSMEPLHDPYMILGVERECSIDEVRKAYLLLSARYHPDKAPKGMRLEASAAMSKINEAYGRIRQDLKDAIGPEEPVEATEAPPAE